MFPDNNEVKLESIMERQFKNPEMFRNYAIYLLNNTPKKTHKENEKYI